MALQGCQGETPDTQNLLQTLSREAEQLLGTSCSLSERTGVPGLPEMLLTLFLTPKIQWVIMVTC